MEFGKVKTAMQPRDAVEGLYNFREFSQRHNCLDTEKVLLVL